MKLNPAAGCGCCSGTKICVTACGGPVAGATVDVYSGSILVASCTTDAAGCCSLSASGTYTVAVTWQGALVFRATRTLNGTTITIPINDPSAVCCGPHLLPPTLFLTSFAGTVALTYDGSGWHGCQTYSADEVILYACSTFPAGDPVCVVGSGTVTIQWAITCSSTQLTVSVNICCAAYGGAIAPPTLASFCDPPPAGGWFVYCDTSHGHIGCTGAMFASTCAGGGYTCGLSDLVTSYALSNRAPSSWSPLAWSGTLAIRDPLVVCSLPSLGVTVNS